MKRTQKLSWLLVSIMLFAGSLQSFSQTIQEFFNNKSTPLTYLGIDFTKNKLINDTEANASDAQSRHYNSMNEVVVNEMEKNYKIADAFERNESVTVDITAVREKNQKINVSDILSSNEADFNRLSKSDIEDCIKALNLNGKQGVGLVFIMEGMKRGAYSGSAGDKTMYEKNYGAVWITLIDMKTKKVLLTERMEQQAVGFGFRNFWISVIKKSIVEIDKKRYKDWEKAYGS